jgi:SAM-dependent methyltransferase
MNGWQLACPACRGDLDRALACASCGATYGEHDGVLRLVAAERLAGVERFLADYTMVRHAEGRGSDDPAYYRRLPEPTDGDPLAWQWTIRAATWRHVERRVLPQLGAGLRVLDLGAGVGWLSNRVAAVGHHPFAIDLSVDALDGLGAARHYDDAASPAWPRAQAEFDRLPLAGGQADLVVYNASLHYSTDYGVTLGEAVRVLAPGGHLLVIDSPVYRRDESGRTMVTERHADFERRFGTRSDSVPSIEYLTDAMLRQLGADLGLRWERSIAWYGWRWWWRPYRARLKRNREPSRFVTLLASREHPVSDLG